MRTSRTLFGAAIVLIAAGYAVADEMTQIAEFSTTTLISTGTVDVTLTASPGGGVAIAGYMVNQSSTPPDPGDTGWAESVSEYTVADGTPDGYVTLYGWAKDSVGTVVGASLSVMYIDSTEIPKEQMTATASGGTASAAIDGVRTGDGWMVTMNPPPQWLQLDLGQSYEVDAMVYQGPDLNGRIKDYKIYVTDGPADRGDPAAAGSFANTDALQIVVFPEAKAGRYLILEALSQWGWAPDYYGATEVWAYGTPIPTGPTIAAFTAADQTTGSALFTNSATVDVSITAEPVAPETPVAGVLVTETPDVPDVNDPGWAASITEYSITGGEGSITLYAWAKDTADVIGDPASATILFSTAVPVVSNVAVTDNGDGTATATWTTGVPAQGGAKYGPASQAGTMPNEVVENAAGTGHSIESQISWPVDQSLCSELRSREDWPTGQPDPTLCTLHLAGFAVERCAPFRFRHRPAQWFSRGCSRERRWIAGS